MFKVKALPSKSKLVSAVFLALVFLALVLFQAAPCLAERVYQPPEEFIAETFGAVSPEVKSLMMLGERKKEVTRILSRKPRKLRTRYWRKGDKTAWILEEIGKTKLITAGFVVEDGKISNAKVLVYRESHGDEVRHSFFLKQFFGLELNADRGLDGNIDGISGATLSVRSMKKMATLALFLDNESKKR